MRKTLSIVILACASLMATAQQSNTVTIDPDGIRTEYNPMIFGQFIEHFDNQVYGGIFDPGNPLSDEDGFRTDVIEAMKAIKVPIVRWPGGCFVSSYHWKGGIGPERTAVFDKSWGVEDPNTFGTDEYIKWCRKVGCEPYICTNAGTGTPEEMSDWVEYCNLNVGKWGRLRQEYGHQEPYNVKYWSVGNENYGRWELGARTVAEWGPYVAESAKLMRAVTKDLKLFAAATNGREWTLPLLKSAGWILDYISIHGYWNFTTHKNTIAPYIKCMMYTNAPENDINKTIKLLDEAGFGGGKIKIAYDEWNLRSWHHPGHGMLRQGFDIEARRNNDINSTYTMADAIFSACFLNSCLRHSDVVDIACFSPIVNTRGAIRVDRDGITRRTTYYTFYMYTNMLEKYMVPVSLTCSNLTYEKQQTPVLDAVLTSDKEGKRFVYAIVNKDPDNSTSLTIDFASMNKKAPKKLNGWVLSGRSADDYNDRGDEHVKPEQHTFRVSNGSVTIPPHTVAFITIE